MSKTIGIIVSNIIFFSFIFGLCGSSLSERSRIPLSLIESSLDEPVEEWNHTFGGSNHENGWSVKQTNDGGYIISGETASFGNGNYDVFLIKTNEDGETQWEKTYGEFGYDQGWCVCSTDDGGYIISASSDSFGNGDYDLYLIKTDDMGNEIWSKTYGGPDQDFCHSIIPTDNSGYVIIGATMSFGAGNLDVYLVKIDENGNELWSRTFGGVYEDNAGTIYCTDDGGFIIAGYTDSYDSGGGDVWLIKTDSDGIEEWSKTFGGNQLDTGMSVKQTSDTGFIIAGLTRSFGLNVQAYVIKTDASGNEEWSNTYGGAYYDEIDDIIETTDGDFIFTGRTDSNSRSIFDVFFGNIDSNGNELWSTTFGGVKDDWGWNIQKTSDSCYVIVGTTYSYGSGDGDVWLIKINPNPENVAPLKPELNGPTEGKKGITYDYNVVTTDLNEDQLFYLFEWGDGNNSGWLGPYDSGEKCIASYCWSEKGDYTIKAKAKDSYGAESDWSDPLPVSVPTNKIFISRFLEFINNNHFLFPILRIFLNNLGVV